MFIKCIVHRVRVRWWLMQNISKTLLLKGKGDRT